MGLKRTDGGSLKVMILVVEVAKNQSGWGNRDAWHAYQRNVLNWIPLPPPLPPPSATIQFTPRFHFPLLPAIFIFVLILLSPGMPIKASMLKGRTGGGSGGGGDNDGGGSRGRANTNGLLQLSG